MLNSQHQQGCPQQWPRIHSAGYLFVCYLKKMGFENCRKRLHQRFLNWKFLATCHQISWIFQTSISHNCISIMHKPTPSFHTENTLCGFSKFHNRTAHIKHLSPDLHFSFQFPKSVSLCAENPTEHKRRPECFASSDSLGCMRGFYGQRAQYSDEHFPG